jgi:hypothetical protein
MSIVLVIFGFLFPAETVVQWFKWLSKKILKAQRDIESFK